MTQHWFFGTVIFALAASFCWGIGTFSGGLVARRSHAFSIVIAVHATGLVLLIYKVWACFWPWLRLCLSLLEL